MVYDTNDFTKHQLFSLSGLMCAGVMDSKCIESVPYISMYALDINIYYRFFRHIEFDCIISIFNAHIFSVSHWINAMCLCESTTLYIYDN